MKLPILLGTCLILCGGCASFPKSEKMSLKNPFSKKEKEPEPYPTPVKLAATWAPDTLSTAGKRPTRGFGGRLFFYDQKSRPVPVEGDLTVTAYVPSDNPTEPTKVKRFGFTKEQLTKHYSQSDLGASYSIWIPWDVDGGNVQMITMVPSFKSEQMNVPIQGSATAVMLPGTTPNAEEVDAVRRIAANANRIPPNNGATQIRQAGFIPQGYQQNPQSGYTQSRPQSGLNTLTIPVDSNFTRNLRR